MTTETATETATKPNLLAGYFTPDQAAAALGYTARTLWRWEVLNQGPPITRIGRKKFYNIDTLEAWVKSREQKIAA